MTYILGLHEIDKTALPLVGGKAANLGELKRAGIPVPAGFVITTAAYDAFVAHNQIADQILELASSVPGEEPSAFEAVADAIRPLFEQGEIPAELAAAICQAYEVLIQPSRPWVAVRSSATAEDLPSASFAGQQETFLNIHGQEALLEAVKKCWASLWTARAMAYRARQGIEPAAVKLAVIVQEMVSADVAGILFTANPTTGARDEVVITASWGLGEAIVGGRVTPDTVVADKQTGEIKSYFVAEKTVMTVATVGGTTEIPVPTPLRQVQVLDQERVSRLVQLGREIEQLYGTPQDIEWALVRDSLSILQSRPVTALPAPPVQPPTTWELPHSEAMYWRASIVEMMPDPLSPLFADLIEDAVDRSIRELLREWQMEDFFLLKAFATIHGYGYYQFKTGPRHMLMVFRKMMPLLLKILGEAESRWREQGRPRYAHLVAKWSEKPIERLSATELLAGVAELVYGAAAYYTVLQSGIIPAATFSELVFTLFYNLLVRQKGDPPAYILLLGFDSIPIRAEKSLYDLALWCREVPSLADALAEMPTTAVLEHFRSGEPPAGVSAGDWQAFCHRFQTHLDTYGHIIYDLDFVKPVPADDPLPLLRTLQFYIRGQGSNPYERQQALVRQREATLQAIRARLRGWRRQVFEKLLAWAQHYNPLREDGFADMGLGWPLARRMLRELGQRLVQAGAIQQPDDVFWLTQAELQTLAQALDAGQAQLPSYQESVEQRKALWQARKQVVPPPALPVRARLWGLDLERWLPARVAQPATDEIRGVGASPGRVVGPACVVHGPEDFDKLQPGDILVAGITTPAWTPLFALAAGVVTDVGGPLSHSSIVAREYGIPAVLGTGVATKRIRSGQQVWVDGDAGVVRILES